MATKQRVAVLGGGLGALSAAFYLTEEPGWDERYEITVYQQGWRLGGKCASSHDLRPGYGERIVEHGLHIFAGFYDQSFDLLRRAYDVVDRPSNHPNPTVWDAFDPADEVTLIDPMDTLNPDHFWQINFSPNDLRPGDQTTTEPIEVMIRRMLQMVLGVQAPGPSGPTAPMQPIAPARPPGFFGDFGRAWAAITGLLAKAEHEIVGALKDEVLHLMIWCIEAKMLQLDTSGLPPESQLELRRVLYGCYLAQTVLRGISEDHVLERGYDSIDIYEASDWIKRHAVEVAKGQNPKWGDPEQRASDLINWPPLVGAYDYVFGRGRAGDPLAPNVGAGTLLRGMLLMISYRGHFFWKMKGAMGDVVIAPLYLALKKRGVRFEFFSRITQLNIDPAQDRLASIDYVRQARLKDPSAEYAPLIGVPIPGWPKDQPLEGWPDQPLWDQLENGAALQAAGRNYEADHLDAPGAADEACTLQAGVDFDVAVLGIALGAVKQVCASFPARLPASKWGPMFETMGLTRTCAMQIWFTRTSSDLGCSNADRAVNGSDQPYSSWADMSHLLSRETWRGDEVPRSIAYFCGQIQGPENGEAANRKAYAAALEWLKSGAATFFPAVSQPHGLLGFDPALMYDPDPGAPGDALSRQYIRANTAPSDLYVQSVVDSVFTRMDANHTGVQGLIVAGDWTLNGINAGAAEAAARSGWRAAKALVGKLEPLPVT